MAGGFSGRSVAAALIAASTLTLVAGCGRVVPRASVGPAAPEPATAPPAATPGAGARAKGIEPGPEFATIAAAADDAAAALASFRESCPRLLARTDQTGLTRPADWRAACAAAARTRPSDAIAFFASWFETAWIGDGAAFATGYYEPEIAGVRARRPGFDVPVYALPPDLARARAGDAAPGAGGRMPSGRYDAAGRFGAYYDRGQIEDGALADRGLEIAWAADPVEFYFLQVQGSGRLRAPDGSVMRIGYAGQNGFAYTGIGSVMRDRGLIGTAPGQYPGSMQGIMRFLRENPAQGDALMRENKSWVFFRELIGDGPLGSLGVPVRARSSVAVDPLFVPLGAPVWLALDRAEASGLWIAQDVGGAIKGANRFDTFWGAGEKARAIAGGMSAHGRALVLLPRGTLARLGAR